MSPLAKKDAAAMVKSDGEIAQDYPGEVLNVITKVLIREGRRRPDLI